MPSTPLSSFLAGIAGGSASTILLYPLDLVKVRMQVDERRRNSVLHKNYVNAASITTNNSATKNNIATVTSNKPRTICTTVRGVIRHEGYLGLYRGLTPAIIGSAASWGGFFIIYEEMKRQLLVRKHRQYDAATIANNNISTSNTTTETQQQTTQEVTVKLGPIEHFSASCLSGACMVALTNPLWLIKTRLQLQNSKLIEQQISSQQSTSSAQTTTAAASKTSVVSKNTTSKIANSVKPKQQQLKPPYKGLIHAATTIIQEEGILALYKGSIPALMLVSHGGIQFVTYEFLKGHFTNFFDGSTNKSVGDDKKHDKSERKKISGKKNGTIRERMRDSLGYLVMGAVSKFVASTTTYPLQVIKARLQQRSQVIEVSETTGEVIVSKREYSGVIDCIQRIIKNEGMNGFFKGCLTNALRVAPSAAITFVTYEFVLDMLSD